jgi:hypothetical protein
MVGTKETTSREHSGFTAKCSICGRATYCFPELKFVFLLTNVGLMGLSLQLSRLSNIILCDQNMQNFPNEMVWS